MTDIPASSRILVVGGGPGGSTAATLLARQGFEVTLLEQAHFPRYHIGESLLPTVLPIIDLLGAREKIEAFGFQRKPGAYLEWGPEQWTLNFGELSGNTTYSFQVTRAEFDHMLLEHAKSQGVNVFEGVEVRSITHEDGRPKKAGWLVKSRNGGAGQMGEIAFDYLVDASGRNGLMSTHYLKSRRYHKVFQNIALWGYWENADRLATGREGDIAVSSIPEGWIWAIPLHDGTMSVGVVMHKEILKKKQPLVLEHIYQEALRESPLIQQIVAPGRLVSGVRSETDYSYAAEHFCGPGFFLVGDAACFLDPLLSSGVHLATLSGTLAAAGLSSLIRGEVGEEEVMSYYEHTYRQAYLRFLVFLSAFYDVGRAKETYFWEAQRLTQEDVDSSNLKKAFLKLVTGVKDLNDVQNEDAHQFVLQEMTRRIDENLTLRKDKLALASLEGEKERTARANARFFDSVEGIFALNEEEAVGGLYLVTEPQFGLGRVKTMAKSG
jgi:flavin-dependent dehydrogenase